MKKLLFDGNLGKDAEILTTTGGRKYVRFTVANKTFKNGEDNVDWIDVYSYDDYIIEKKAPNLLKGRRVVVQGDVDFKLNIKNGRAWVNTRVVADFIEIIGGFSKKEEGEYSTVAADAETEVSTYTAVTKDIKVAEKPSSNPIPSNVQNEIDDLPF